MGEGAGPGSLESVWTIWEREMLDKMNRCAAGSAYEVQKHMQNSHRKTGSSSV